MNYGVAIFFTDYSIMPVEMGSALEERGFESLWAPEHSHIPLTRKSPYPQGGSSCLQRATTTTESTKATTRMVIEKPESTKDKQRR